MTMANLVYNFVSGPGIEEDKDRAIRVLGSREACGKYAGYDFSFHAETGVLEFSTRGNSPVPALAELSKHGMVELVRCSEGSQFQQEKAMRLENGVVTGHRERFVADGIEPWGDWVSITRAESDEVLAHFSSISGRPGREEPVLDGQVNGMDKDMGE